VGKSYAMLSEGLRRKERGADVVIGFVECHGRQRTEELIDDLELIPPRAVDYRSTRFEEMDLDAVLYRGRRWSWWTSWPTPTSRAPAATRSAGRM